MSLFKLVYLKNERKYLKDKLKETINLFNNSKIKIFSDNSNVECFEEKVNIVKI